MFMGMAGLKAGEAGVAPPAGPVVIVDSSAAAQDVNADPWPAFVLTLTGAENKIVVIVAHGGLHTFAVTAAGIDMVAGPTSGPGDPGTGVVWSRSFYLDRGTVGEAGWPPPGSCNIVVNPSAGSARGACCAWALSNAIAGTPNRNATATALTGPTTVVSLTSVPADVVILGGFVNNTSATASSVAGAETQDANFDQAGGTANQVFASSTPAAPGTVTYTYTSPSAVGAYIAALMLEILPGGGGGNGEPVLFRVGTSYPEYVSTQTPGVSHAQIPWAKLDELYYFGFSPRVDYSTTLNVTTEVFSANGHPFTNGQAVQLRNISGAATPSHAGGSLVYDTNYFVREVVAGVSFKLEPSVGAGAFNFTVAGAADGRRFKAPTAYLNRYEFNPPADQAATASLFAQRDAQNTNCRIWLELGRDHNVEALYDAMNYNSGNGVNELMASTLAIYNEQDFIGVLVDIEPLDVSGGLPVGADFTADGPIMQQLHAALRATLPAGALIGWYTGVTGPLETKEHLAARMMADDHLDIAFLSGYAMVAPGVSSSQCWHHGALNHTVSDYGTPTANAQHGIIKMVGQYTNDAGIPASKLALGIQAGGQPWVGGVMSGTGGNPGGPSAGHGARFPLDIWTGGANAPDAQNEVTYRNRGLSPSPASWLMRLPSAFSGSKPMPTRP